MIVAINKIDKPERQPGTGQAASSPNSSLMPEEWGGETVTVEVSARKEQNIDFSSR